MPGSIYQIEHGKLLNIAPVIDPAGAVVARYRKMFPFRPYEEGVTAATPFACCRLPELARSAYRSVTTCGFPRPPAAWSGWARGTDMPDAHQYRRSQRRTRHGAGNGRRQSMLRRQRQ